MKNRYGSRRARREGPSREAASRIRGSAERSSIFAARLAALLGAPLVATFAALVLLASGLSGGLGSAHASQVDIGRLERELMNPCENCGGKPLAGSYCGGATDAKTKLRGMVDQGLSHEEVVDAFVAEYGEWILAVPEKRGFNLFAWILPIAGMLAGGGGLALFLRRTNAARRVEQGEGISDHEDRAGPVPDRVQPPGPGIEELRRRLESEVGGR